MEQLKLGNDLERFKHFLDEYCKSLKKDDEENDYVPLRISNTRLTVEEIEGECLEWCLHFLSTRHCPTQLAALLAREVYVRVSNLDLQEYVSVRENGRSSEEETNQNGKADQEEGQNKKEEETVLEYNAEKLQDAVLDTLETVCTSWQGELPDLGALGECRQLKHAYYAIKNTRRKMEDSHIIVPDLNALFGLKESPRQSFYGIFDGHAGVDAANYASRHIHCNLVHRCSLDTDPCAAIQKAFNVTDQLFIPKAKREHWRSGSTGVAALVRGDKLYMAWLGDSQAVLVRDGRAVTHMEPHKPDRQDERDRIESQGGFVMLMGDLWRVGGNLAVSRSIGDVAYKPFISSDAEVLVEELDGTEDYMVLACDGLWDVVQEDELPRIIHEYLIDGGERSGVAKHLVQLAKNRDSMDNISVIVVYFRENIAEPKFDLFNFGQVNSQGGEQKGEDHSDKGDNGDQQDKKGDNVEDGSKDTTNESGGLNDVIEGGENVSNDKGNEKVNNFEVSFVPLKDYSSQAFPVETSESATHDTPHGDAQSGKAYTQATTERTQFSSEYPQGSREHTQRSTDRTPKTNNFSSVSELSLSNQLQEVDLDYYGVFYGQKDHAFSDQNSSNLLRDIADCVYNRRYSTHMSADYNTFAKENIQALLDRGPFTDRRGLRKKPKRPKKKLPKVKKEYNTKGLATTPMCWAFTGRNKANVPNHRLNMAAKSTVKGTNPTPGELILASKAPPSLSEKSSRFSSHIGSLDHLRSVSLPLSQVRLESLSIPKHKLASLDHNPFIKVFGSTASIQSETEKFHTTWRPRKPLKPIAPTVFESPPSPFVNNKLDTQRDL